MGGGKGGKVTVGYHYYMNVHLALGVSGIQELQEIRIGDRIAWKGSVTGAGSALVSQTGLFGGEKREGGVCGIVDFMPGGSSQDINESIAKALEDQVGSPLTPNYKGITSVFMKGIDGVLQTGKPWHDLDPGTLDVDGNNYDSVTNMGTIINNLKNKIRHNFSFCWSAMNPYFKVPWFKVRRNFDDWYPERAAIDGNSNPAHIYYEILTNPDWGMGEPSSNIDDISFRAAADTFFTEGLGLSFTWSNPQFFEEIIEYINDHCNANLVEDRTSGKWKLRLIRDDFDYNTIPELNESNCKVTNISAKTLSDTINEVVVSYTNLEDGKEDTVVAQDLANFVNQGRVNSQKREYPAVTNAEIASKLAFRDLATLSKPLKKVTVESDKSMFDVYPGDPVKLVWPREGVDGLVFRVGKMDMGELEQGKIQMELVEDVFALPQQVYTTVNTSSWVNTERSPEPVLNPRVFELSYYEVFTSTSSADRLDWPNDAAVSAVVAEAPNSDTRTYRLFDEVGQKVTGDGEFTPTYMTGEDVIPGQTDILLSTNGFTDIYALVDGGLAWLNNELVEVTNFDINTGRITVNRGCIDTIPDSHASGSIIHLYNGFDHVVDNEIRVTNETVQYRLLTETSKGELQVLLAPVETYTLPGRLDKPYPPGNVRVNGEVLVETILNQFSLTWSHRDRTQQLAGIPKFLDTSVGLEEGVEYSLKIYDETDSVVVSENTTSGSFTYDIETEGSDLNTVVTGYSGIFSDSVGVYDSNSPVWIKSVNAPIFFDGTYIVYHVTAVNPDISPYSYGALAYMDAAGSTIEFNDSSNAGFTLENGVYEVGNGVIAHNINRYFRSEPLVTARNASDVNWETHVEPIGIGDTPEHFGFDGANFRVIKDNGLTGNGGTVEIGTSTDGYQWSFAVADFGTTRFNVSTPIKFINGKYYIGGQGEFVSEGVYTVPLAVSTDLLTFTELSFPEVYDYHETTVTTSTFHHPAGFVTDIIEYSGNIVVSFWKTTQSGVVRKVYRTEDEGSTWVDITPAGITNAYKFKVVLGQLFLFTDYTNEEYYRTSDLVNWVNEDLSSLRIGAETKFLVRGWVTHAGWVYFTTYHSDGVLLNSGEQKHWKTQDMSTITEIVPTINANVSQGSSGRIQNRLNSRLRYELHSFNTDGTSWQKYDNTVERVGYGYNYGRSYGGK